MARKNSEYKRLPGRAVSLFDVRSLWQGTDHLLWVESVFFKENYKRFFYRDIQSLVMQRGETHRLWSAFWGALAFICGLIAFLVPGTPYLSGAFGAIFLLALGVNLALGPSCAVYLQTAVQVQRLSSLKRIRTAQKAMARIKGLVEAVQRPWEQPPGPGDPAAAANGALYALPGSSAAWAGHARERVPAEPFQPQLHQLLFGLLLALGILAAVQVLLKSLSVAVLGALLHGTIQIMAIIALARWHRQLKGTLIAKINWLTLVFISVQSAIGYGLYFAASFRNPLINYHHWEMFKMLFQLQMTDHPLALTGNLIYATGSFLLGIIGLLILGRRLFGSETWAR